MTRVIQGTSWHLMAVLVLTGPLLPACQAAPLTEREESEHEMIEPTAVATETLPPIDAAAPNHTETATFAMG
jgi:hypothetical protein